MGEYRKTPDPPGSAPASQAPPPPTPPSPTALGDQSDRALAVAWARSTGFVKVPNEPHRFNGWVCFLLAWLWLIPAIIYFLWCESNLNAYNNAISDALRLWKVNGSPDPYAAKMGIAQVVTNSQSEPSGLSEKLQELVALKEKGLLAEDEFSAAKKKLLGI